MFEKIKSTFKKYFQNNIKNEIAVNGVKEVKQIKEINVKERKYRNIPLYTEEEMKNALNDDSDNVRNKCLGRQALNGYVGIYMGKWIVGRRQDGQIVKACKPLLFEVTSADIEKRNNYILDVQRKALLGEDIQDEMFCKFTYDMENQDKFAIHVTLMREYIEGKIMEDAGDYGGIHFVSIDDIEICANSLDTYYGNKIALIRPVCGEVYYEYMQGVFVGKKVYVEKVMYLDNVQTWEYLNQKYTSIKKNTEVLCNYLKGLELIDGKNYKECIAFLEEL